MVPFVAASKDMPMEKVAICHTAFLAGVFVLQNRLSNRPNVPSGKNHELSPESHSISDSGSMTTETYCKGLGGVVHGDGEG